MNKKLAPSILDADFTNLENELTMLEESGADLIHLDIMDGHFVPNISFGSSIVKAIRGKTNLPLNIHLMVECPENHIESFTKAGGDIITIHYESSKHLEILLTKIKEMGMKCGLALNPETPLKVVEYLLDKVDLLLVMTVNPGFGGQKFIPEMMDKISKARKMINNQERIIDLEVDGGLNLENIPKVIKAGANIVVVGSAIFKSLNPRETIIRIKKVLKLTGESV